MHYSFEVTCLTTFCARWLAMDQLHNANCVSILQIVANQFAPGRPKGPHLNPIPFSTTRSERFGCVLLGLDKVHLARVAFASVGKRAVLEQPGDLGLVTVVRPSVA